MSKSVKKIKIRKGKDATESIVVKLTRNFIKTGKVKTTLKRAKILKAQIDRLVHKALDNSESSRNVLLKRLGAVWYVNKLINEIGPKLNKRTSGYVKLVRLGARFGDGAELAQVTWVEPVESVVVANHEGAKVEKPGEIKVEDATIISSESKKKK